jgi:hypothetical protein
METIGNDLRQMQRTPLAASHVEALRVAGKVATYPAGVFLARPGEPIVRCAVRRHARSPRTARLLETDPRSFSVLAWSWPTPRQPRSRNCSDSI